MKERDVVFTVEGMGCFPLDMLRRDRCFPASESDANSAQGSTRRRVITLISPGRPVYWQPTADRWESFGWTVGFDA